MRLQVVSRSGRLRIWQIKLRILGLFWFVFVCLFVCLFVCTSARVWQMAFTHSVICASVGSLVRKASNCVTWGKALKGEPPGWSSLLFLGRCRTQDLSLGEDLQRQRGREHMWREAQRPNCINPGFVWRYIKTYLHPIPRSPENKTWIIYSRVQGSLSVAPWVSPSLASYFFLLISVTR